MNEYFFSEQFVSSFISEEEENLGMKPLYTRVKCKVSLKNIQCIFETKHSTGVSGVGIDCHNDTYQFIIDDFEKISKLHDQYLKAFSNEKIQLN